MGESILTRKGGSGGSVNIPSYSNFAMSDENSVNYQVHNGYDYFTNPTPSLTNLIFNEWYIKNDTNRTVIMINTVTQIISNIDTGISNAAVYVDNTVGINQGLMLFTNVSAPYNANVNTLAINNGFIYAGGITASGINRGVSKFHESNLVLVGNTVNFGGNILSIAINNGFIYAAGQTDNTVKRYHEGNLVFVDNSPDYLNAIYAIAISNGYVYAGGNTVTGTNRGVSQYHESNLVLVGNTVNFGGSIRTIAVNNGFIYAGGLSNTRLKKYDVTNLALTAEVILASIVNISINNGFVYASFGTNITKRYESNLTQESNISNFTAKSMTTNNGYLYACNNTIGKFYESNLTLLSNSRFIGGEINSVIVNNGYIYTGMSGSFINSTRQHQDGTDNLVEKYIYKITNVKE
jgi:hypothetical protein